MKEGGREKDGGTEKREREIKIEVENHFFPTFSVNS